MSASPSPSSVRADAISRLKRAASLPRMANGRRPGIPANGGAFSEGGRSQEASVGGDESPVVLEGEETPVMEEGRGGEEEASATTAMDTHPSTLPTPQPAPDPVQLIEVPPSPPLSPSPSPQKNPSPSPEPEPEPEPIDPPDPPSMPLQTALLIQHLTFQRALAMSPTHAHPAFPHPHPHPPSAFPPALISPTPQSYQDLMLAAQSSTPSGPTTPAQRFHHDLSQAAFYLPPTSPINASSYPRSHAASPLPSLQEIQSSYQRGLFRSNSAAARSEAWSKLTGGRETPLTSPPATPAQHLGGKLGRSNTVTGGERLAMRGRMMDVLDRRRKEAQGGGGGGGAVGEAQSGVSTSVAELTSAGEESTVEKSERKPGRRRRRHSASKSVSVVVVVDDRDMPTNAPGTPAPTGPTALPEEIPPVPAPPEDMLILRRPDSVGSSVRRHSMERDRERNRDSALARLTGEDKFEYDALVGGGKTAGSAGAGGRTKAPGRGNSVGRDSAEQQQQPPQPKSPRPLPPIPKHASLQGPGTPNPPDLAGRASVPHTPSLSSSLPYPNPPFHNSSARAHHGSDAPSNVSSGGYTDLGIPLLVYREGTGSMGGGRESFPVTVAGSSVFGTPVREPVRGMEGTPEGQGYVSPPPRGRRQSLEGTPERGGRGKESGGLEGEGEGSGWYGWIEQGGEGEGEGDEKVQDRESEIVDKTIDLSDDPDPPRPSPPPPPPAAVPPALGPPIAFPTDPTHKALPSLPPQPQPAGRSTFVSEASSTSFVPASTTHRSRTDSCTDFEQTTEYDTSAVEERDRDHRSRPRQAQAQSQSQGQARRSPSRIGEKVKNLLHTVSSRTGLRQRERAGSMTGKAERREKTGSGHSTGTAAGVGAGNRDSRENAQLTSASAVSLLSQSLSPASKSVVDMSGPSMTGSPMPALTPELRARYRNDKLWPLPAEDPISPSPSHPLSPTSTPTLVKSEDGMSPFFSGMRTQQTARQAERERMRGGGVGSPVSADGFDLDLGDLRPDTRGVPGETTPPQKAGGAGGGAKDAHAHAAEKVITYIDVSSPPLPQSRNAVRDWIKLNLRSPSSNSDTTTTTTATTTKRKPSLTDLLSSARFTDSGTEKESSAEGRGSLGRSLTKKPSPPKLPSMVRPGTAPSAIFGTLPKSKTSPAPVSAPAPAPQIRSTTNARTDNSSSISSDPSGPLSIYTPASEPSGSAASTPSGSQDSSVSQPSQPSAELPAPAAQKKNGRVGTPPTPSSSSVAIVNTTPVSFHLRPLAPRKVMLHSTVLQVVQGDVLKERCLFLFTDVLVIAKPLMQLQEGKDGTLDRPMQVKSVVDLRNLRIKKREPDVGQTTADKLQPAMRAFVEEFARNPGTAVDKLAQQHGLRQDPATIADVLFETPALDKAQLGEYLAQRSARHVLRAYIDRFGFEDVRVDVALRTFLLSIRLPEDQGGLEHLLETFANRWWEANSRTNGFDKESAQRLVAAMMQLSDALHSETYFGIPFFGGSSPSKRHISVDDWIDAFRATDPRQLVPEVMLRKIFYNIRSFRLAEALDVSQSDAEVPAAMIPAKIRTRLTHSEPSERITVRIPRPDRNFAIRLYGHGMKFDPEFLDFSNATEQSFVIIPSAVGVKTVIFGREGVNSPLYTGLPLSKTFLVERAFMQNTFQLAFVNHLGVKRKYLYSMEDPFLLDKWTDTLTTQIARRQSPSNGLTPDAERKMAADAIAFTLLRDTLLTDEPSPLSSSAELRGGSRASTMRSPRTADAGDQDKRILGRDLMHVCVQNSLLPGMILRHRANRNNEESAQSDAGRVTPRSRVGTPVARPQTIRVM